jgi:hypothetical protein
MSEFAKDGIIHLLLPDIFNKRAHSDIIVYLMYTEYLKQFIILIIYIKLYIVQ